MKSMTVNASGELVRAPAEIPEYLKNLRSSVTKCLTLLFGECKETKMKKKKLEAKLSQTKKKLEKAKSKLDDLRSVIEVEENQTALPKVPEPKPSDAGPPNSPAKPKAKNTLKT